MELTDRKKQILKVVTERYIDAAEPVSSKFIAQAMGGRLSSATIRNELADLVELGYLEQPHTSAGRVPSPKGYRLYVNELMEKRSVSDQEAAQINEALGGQLRELDAIIARAGQAASAIVSYPAYAVAAGRGSVTVRRYDLLPVDAESFIAVVMTVDSRVKSQLLRTQLPVEPQQLSALANLLNTHFTGICAEEMGTKLMGLTGQLPAELFMAASLAVEYASAVIDQGNRGQVYTTGQGSAAAQAAGVSGPGPGQRADEPADGPEKRPPCAGREHPHADPHRPRERQRGPQRRQRGGGQLRHRGEHAGPHRRGGPHPHGLRRRGRPSELLCRELIKNVWKKQSVTPEGGR